MRAQCLLLHHDVHAYHLSHELLNERVQTCSDAGARGRRRLDRAGEWTDCCITAF